MPPKKTGNKSLEVVQSQNNVCLPTQQQIAKLHTLLQRSQNLAKEINFPITATLFSSIVSLMQSLFQTLTEKIFYDWLALDASSDIPLYTVWLTRPAIWYAYKKIYDGISAIILSIFPNGFTFSRKPHKAYDELHKLSDKNTLDDVIQSLEVLVREQEKSTNKTFYASLIASLVVPFLSSFAIEGFTVKASFTFGLYIRLLGPRIQLINHTASFALPVFIQQLAGDYQGMRFYAGLVACWSNFNTPKQLKQYVRKLNFLSCSNFEWQYHSEEKKDKALFHLETSDEKIEFLDNEGKIHQISKSLYFKELHRILIEAKLPVYAKGKASLYVGYTPLSEKRAKTIKDQLLTRLLEIASHRRKVEKVQKVLQKLITIIPNITSEWENHTIHTRTMPTRLEDHFYLRDIPPAYRRPLADALKTLFGEESRVIEGVHGIEMVSTQIDLWEQTREFDIDSIRHELHEAILQQTPLRASTKSTKFPPQKQAQPMLVEESGEEATHIVSGSAQLYRPSLLFRSGKKRVWGYDEEGIANSSTQPHQLTDSPLIYPLHAPWLPEGQAYAIVKPEVYAAAEGVLTKKEITDCLERGAVHGRSAKKSKQMGARIKTTDEPYCDVSGVSHNQSYLKLKIGNVRIFSGEKETREDGTTLYIFDGLPVPGH